MEEVRGTTILAVRDDKGVAIGGDGQVTLGQSIAIKHRARKIRRLYKERVLVGFAGSTADAFTLLERFEAKLEEFSGNLIRASVELAKQWRTDKYLRRLEAMLMVTDGDNLLLISGTGDVIEPDDNVMGIGSGGAYAMAAAKALVAYSDLGAREIVEASLNIAADMCVFTNDEFMVEYIER